VTIEELRKLHSDYILANLEQGNGNAVSLDAMRVVVRALRDEFREEYGMWERFTQILGSDAGEKVAGSTPASTGRLDSVKGEPPASPATHPFTLTEAQHRHLQYKHWGIGSCDCQMCKPVADAAPAVCEWEKSPLRLYEHLPTILYRTGCGADFFYNYKQCQGCGKPIKFTEANHG
jgi:hypothetical protein